MNILKQAEQWPMRVAMPIQHIPPMKAEQSDFDRIAKQYDIDPKRAGISSQGGMVYTKAGEPAVMMSFVHRDKNGIPLGFLHYFPKGSNKGDRPGDFTVMVHPDHRSKGIGKGLLNAVLKEYGPDSAKRLKVYDYTPIDLDEQRYTPSGYDLYRDMGGTQ